MAMRTIQELLAELDSKEQIAFLAWNSWSPPIPDLAAVESKLDVSDIDLSEVLRVFNRARKEMIKNDDE